MSSTPDRHERPGTALAPAPSAAPVSARAAGAVAGAPPAPDPRRGRRPRLSGAALMAPWSIWLVLFFALPLGFVFVVSFWQMDGQTLQPAFTLDNYKAVFSSGGEQIPLLLRTCLTAVLVVAIVAVLCYPVAYYLVFRMRSAARAATVLTLIALPFLVGSLVRAIAWKGMLGVEGVINGLLGEVGIAPLDWLLFSRFSVVVALVYNTYPFMLFALVLSLETIDRRLVAAARDLGAGAFAGFRRVVLPLSAPGLLIGSVLAFVPAVSASVEPEILGGPSARFTANAISDKFLVAVDWPLGAALTVCFTTAAALICVLFGAAIIATFRRSFATGGAR